MPLKMNSKSMLAILLVLGISAALIVAAISLSRAQLKKAVAAALGTVEVIVSEPNAGYNAVDMDRTTGRVFVVGTKIAGLVYVGIINAWIDNVPDWKVTLPFGGGVSVKTCKYAAGNNEVYAAGDFDIISPGNPPTYDAFLISLNAATGAGRLKSTFIWSEKIGAKEHVIDMDISGDKAYVVGEVRTTTECRAAHSIHNIITGELLDKRTLPTATYGDSSMKAVVVDSRGYGFYAVDVQKRGPGDPITNDIMIFKLRPNQKGVWSAFYGGSDIDSVTDIFLAGKYLYCFGVTGKTTPILLKINAANGDIDATWNGIGETYTAGYVGSVVAYGARSGNPFWRKHGESDLSPIEDDEHSTPYTTTVNDVVPAANADYLAASELDPISRVNYGTLYKWYKPEIADPADLIEALIAKVYSMNLHQGIENSLVAKLDRALKALEKDEAKDYSNVINLLQAFIIECQAQSGKALTEEQANELINDANAIIELLQ